MAELEQIEGFAPSTIGPYQLARRLGRGGLGEVFLAWDERLGRHVAVKRILPRRSAFDRGPLPPRLGGGAVRRRRGRAADLSGIIPGDPRLHSLAGQLAESRGDLAWAAEGLSEAVRSVPSWSNLYRLVGVEARAGNTADARRHPGCGRREPVRASAPTRAAIAA